MNGQSGREVRLPFFIIVNHLNHNTMRRIISFIGSVLLMCSCIYEDLSDCPNFIQGIGKPVDVEFCVSCTDSIETKSSISASETAVTNLNLFVYYDGKLETSSYIESPTSFSMSLVKGRTYNMYALANMGRMSAPFKEEEIKSYQYSISKVTDIKLAFPMCWSLAEKTISGSGPRININLERMVSRINFSIDSSELEDFTVTAVRLRQAALKMYPFFDNGSEGSMASNLSEVGDGDWASSSDLTKLNAGQKIWFYALENCQGVLLPGNKSAESKIPSEIPYGSELCTYLEMTASYSGEYEGVPVSSDNVVYRFYIGNDNCSDFNVRRNNSVDISLTVTRDRIFDESWKVSYGDDLPEVSYGLEIGQDVSEVPIGGTGSLSANYYRIVDGSRDQNTDVTAYAEWTSSNESVATVSKGVVTGVSKGTATITATYNGYRVTHTVTVTDVITYKLYLSPSSGINVVNGKTNKLTAILGTYTNGVQTNGSEISSKCTWTSSNTSIATVNNIGLVTGVSTGTVTITAEYNGMTASGTATVTSSTTYELAINPASMTLNKGATGTFTALYKTYTDGVLKSSVDVTSSTTWSSADTKIAGVSQGHVSGVGAGTVIITAKYNGYTATASVTVRGPATLTLGWSSQTVTKGKVLSNAAIYNPNDGTSAKDVTITATWTTSNAAVATVAGGSITAQGAGTAILTATYNGISASCVITVTGGETPPANTYVSNMSVSSEWMTGNTYKLMLTLTFSDGTKIKDVPYTWSVTYAQSPNISASQSGEGPIVYTGGGSTYTMAVTVTTTGTFKDSSGNSRRFTTGTSFSHNVDWTP